MEYLINYNNETTEQLVDMVHKMDGLPLKEMKIKDLVYHNGKPIYTGNGVYIFKSPVRYYYVGNCVARNFVERIPAHFDIRKSGWFNSLLKAIIKDEKKVKIEITDLLLESAASFAFENLNLILINFNEYNRTEINNLENILGKTLKPLNNRFNRLR
ncbi:hypothetical protein ACFFLS_06020 [Flavobacterium procerum]|uniref:GIY-YIG domain-containing protein n=1 Tax=Flavobacterium procerum TaxID=1455569 RepID=A0ABV6BMB6_9FLAO